MRTISLLNIKGGVGKTTASINLATGLAMLGKRTLLVDLDPQASTTSMFLDNAPPFSASALLKGQAPASACIIPIEENLWLLPAELDLVNTEIEIRLQPTTPQHNRLQSALESVRNQFDYCVIDNSPSISLLTVNAIIASRLVIIPIKPDRFAIQGFDMTIKSILELRENWKLDLDYRVLFNIVNRNNTEREIVAQMRELVQERAYISEIRSQPKPIAEASAMKRAVIKETAASCGVASDMRALLTEILEGAI